MSSLNRRHGLAGVFACVLPLACGQPTHALNIILNYNPGAADAVNPSFDPFGNLLTPLFQYAETFYQDVFEDNHTLTINYWYNDLPDNLLGRHSPVSQSGGRVTESNIRIDTQTAGGTLRNYFFDPTPADNNEFTMGQTLWRDLSATNRADWFNFGAFVPDTFEVGFGGPAIGGSAAAGRTDLLSVVLHEVGHALGMSSGNNTTVAETNDGDYDFNPLFVLGATLAAETANIIGNDNQNIAHLGCTQCLMFPTIAGGRTHPSHTDLFAMASGSFYTQLDVPRREFYGDSIGDGNGSWNTNAHWSGNRTPGTADDVFLRDAQGPGTVITAFLTANGFARDISVSEGANIDTNAFKLDATGDVTVSDLNSDIFIDTGGELEADEVFIRNQAEIEMSGGTLDARRVTVDAGTQIESTLAGSATVQISERLINNGTLRATGDSLLYFNTTTPTPWDLDGTSGDGILNASNGRIWFDTGAMTDAFGGEVIVGAGQFFRFDAPWSLESGGVIDLNGGVGTAERARIIGGTLTATGTAVLEAAGQAEFDNAVDLGPSVRIETGAGTTNLEFNAAANLNGTDFTLRTGGTVEFDATTDLTGSTAVNTILNISSTLTPRIQFDAQTNYSSYTLTKTGTPDLIVQQTGNARYVGTNTINADVYDMDGNFGNNTLTFGDGINNGSLTLNVDAIDTVAGNEFNATLDLSNAGFSGRLTVNLNNPVERWTMAGTANLSGNAFFFLDRMAGTGFNLDGTVNVSNSRVSIDADVDVLDNAEINFAGTTSNLGFKGFTQITAGASFSGPGTVTALSGSELLLHDGVNLFNASLVNSGNLSLLGTGSAFVDDFTQTSNGQWNVDLAGASSTLYDVLVSDDAISLDGTIALSLTGGYLPTLYTTTHTVLNGIFGAALTGLFDQVIGAVQSGFGLAVLYTAQDVQVRAALLGDANLNQAVEQGDLDAILNNWGQSNFTGGAVSWVTGDLNGNGSVEQGDLDLVLNNWGSANAPDFRGIVVPEPVAVIALAALGCLGIRRHRTTRPATTGRNPSSAGHPPLAKTPPRPEGQRKGPDTAL